MSFQEFCYDRCIFLHKKRERLSSDVLKRRGIFSKQLREEELKFFKAMLKLK